MKLDTPLKRNLAGGLCLLAIFTILILVSLTIYNAVTAGTSSTDSGVSACQKMADNVGKNNGDNKPMTEGDYRIAKFPFENSKYADIKVAGVNMVDTIYNLEKQSQGDEDLGGSMVTLTMVTTQWGLLQTACANHGVTVPSLPTAA
jgi:hypothetical protein